jgi:hypothetical protein
VDETYAGNHELIDVTIVSNNMNEINIIENKIVNIYHTKEEELTSNPIDEFVTPDDYNNNPKCMNSLKISQLKKSLKFYKNSMIIPNDYSTSMKKNAKNAIKKVHDFSLTGTKPILLNRLKQYMIQDNNAVKIQRILRGMFVRYATILKGCAKYDRSICVNSTDFYSLEPLIDIDFHHFFSYTDINNFTYGFDIDSLILYINNRSISVKNPYNRRNNIMNMLN